MAQHLCHGAACETCQLGGHFLRFCLFQDLKFATHEFVLLQLPIDFLGACRRASHVHIQERFCCSEPPGMGSQRTLLASCEDWATTGAAANDPTAAYARASQNASTRKRSGITYDDEQEQEQCVQPHVLYFWTTR